MSTLLAHRLSEALCSPPPPSPIFVPYSSGSFWKPRLGCGLRWPGSPTTKHLPLTVASAKGPGGAEEGEQQHVGFFPARRGAQALTIVLTLGFLDAGYSGDWSRIGVLSEEAESALRVAAYGVVPFSLLLLWIISTIKKSS